MQENAALYNKMQHIRSMASSSALSRPNTSQTEHLPAQHATHGHLSDTKNSVHACPQRSHASVPLGVLYGRQGRPDTADSQLGDIASLRHWGSSSNKQQPGSSPRLRPTSMWQQPLGPFTTAIADGGARSRISHVPASNIQPGVGHGDHAYGNVHVLYPIRT